MKKRVLFALVVPVTLAVWLTGCFCGIPVSPEKVELGERYDSDKIAMFADEGTYDDNYQKGYYEIYKNYLKTANETQFAIHQKTALEIALAVIKEVYPNETFQLGGPMNMSRYGPAYYEDGGCWVVALKNKDYPKDYDPEHLYWVGVYIDVNSGAIKAVIPQGAFDKE